MLSIKKLPTLSASKIQYKICSNIKNNAINTELNKHCPNILNFCRSFSVLHHYTRKSKNPVSKIFYTYIIQIFSIFIGSTKHNPFVYFRHCQWHNKETGLKTFPSLLIAGWKINNSHSKFIKVFKKIISASEAIQCGV